MTRFVVTAVTLKLVVTVIGPNVTTNLVATLQLREASELKNVTKSGIIPKGGGRSQF